MVFFYYYYDFVCAPACRKNNNTRNQERGLCLVKYFKESYTFSLVNLLIKNNNINNALCYLIPDCTTQLWVLRTA